MLCVNERDDHDVRVQSTVGGGRKGWRRMAFSVMLCNHARTTHFHNDCTDVHSDTQHTHTHTHTHTAQRLHTADSTYSHDSTKLRTCRPSPLESPLPNTNTTYTTTTTNDHDDDDVCIHHYDVQWWVGDSQTSVAIDVVGMEETLVHETNCVCCTTRICSPPLLLVLSAAHERTLRRQESHYHRSKQRHGTNAETAFSCTHTFPC